MDGYIKNKQEAIRETRKTIRYKYALTFVILLYIPVWLFGIYGTQKPEEWKTEEIIYANISQERIGFVRGKADILNSQNGGGYRIQIKLVLLEDLQEGLVAGKTYTIIYSETIMGGNILEAIYSDQYVFLDVSASVNDWNMERTKCELHLLQPSGWK